MYRFFVSLVPLQLLLLVAGATQRSTVSLLKPYSSRRHQHGQRAAAFSQLPWRSRIRVQKTFPSPYFTTNTKLEDKNGETEETMQLSRGAKIKQRVTQFAVTQFAKKIVVQPNETETVSNPNPILKPSASQVLKDTNILREMVASNNDAMAQALSADSAVELAFSKADKALEQAELALELAHAALKEAKIQARSAIDSAEDAAVGEAQRASVFASEAGFKNFIVDSNDIDVSTLTYDDVGYQECENMGEPYLDETMCLVPGEAIARVEKAPENSRRIFAGIDIQAGVDDVWKLLTNYERLQDVVPNLVVNEVLEFYDAEPPREIPFDTTVPEEEQCKMLSTQMKGSKLKQVGGAKVAGINFSARTTLEVREWPGGMPDFAHFQDDEYEGVSRSERAKENAKVKLQRYRFPRPFALSTLPTKDISMQSIENDDGEFRMYQGVWRMQPLVGCAPEGSQAMRLTYAVEVSPRPYLPVALVERRIVGDLCNNLASIRDHFESPIAKQ